MCDLEKESMINSFEGKTNLINYFKRFQIFLVLHNI